MAQVAIIIPSYNKAEFLEETIQSVMEQTLGDWECVIVDDGSTDISLKIARNYATKDPRIKAISQTNLGVSAARNCGARNSTAPLMLMLDSDDKIEKTFLENATQTLTQNPKTRLVYAETKFFGDKNEIWELPKYDYEKLIFANQIPVTFLYRRADFDRIGGYDETMKTGLEDWEFLIRLLDRKAKVLKINQIGALYRQGTNFVSGMANKNSAKIFRYIIQKNAQIYKTSNPFKWLRYKRKIRKNLG